MRLCQIILILLWVGWSIGVRAQVPDELSSMPEQWQLTLDGIKSKAQTLMVENNGLQVEYRELLNKVQELQRSIDDQQNKNEQMDQLITQRHGQTDQQVRIEELSQLIKTKKQEARINDEQWGILKRKQSGVDRRIRRLKQMIPNSEQGQEQDQSGVQDQLTQLRNQLEEGNKQEVVLENEMEALKNGDKSQNLNVQDIEAQNRALETRLDALRLQKLQHTTGSSGTAAAQINGPGYDNFKKRKEELEADINAYELRLDELRQSPLMTSTWALKKKKLVHEMVLTDARNNRMREGIKVLREDIDVLRDQVARLERRVDFVKGQQSANFISTP